MSAAVASDSSPQSLGSGSDRVFTVSDRRSAVSSMDDMDTGYPSRLVVDFFCFNAAAAAATVVFLLTRL